MAVNHKAFAKAAERRKELAKGLRSVKLTSDEWVVKDSLGRPVATGFDDQAEADQWIAEQQ